MIKINLENKIIAVIGLGYVGLPLAVEFGKKRPVIGFDINTHRIEELRNGKDHTQELSQEELLDAAHLTFTSDSSALREAQIFIVTVPTPVDRSNRPDFTHLVAASEMVGKVLKENDIVIYESTVYPGATEEVCAPILERKSGLCYLTEDDRGYGGCGFYLAYSPERINPGDKARRLTQVKKITSGSTPLIAEAVDNLYGEIILAGTYKVSSIKIAEAAKVIENAQRDLNIAFVNELSMIFNRMGIDTSEVLEAAGTKWNFMQFKPGLVGGHCIGVDPYYLTAKAQELGYNSQVILAGRKINDDMGRYVAYNLIKLMCGNGLDLARSSVGILGITFKENCPDVRNSKVIDIIRELNSWGLSVKVSDPLASINQVRIDYGLDLVELSKNNGVDALIVAVAHEQYASMTPRELRSLCMHQRNPVVADLKSIYDRQSLEAEGFSVFRL